MLKENAGGMAYGDFCGLYRTIGLQGKIDLLVSKTDGMTIYETKAKDAKAEDLNQLRLCSDGCAMDGVPSKESALIEAHHLKKRACKAKKHYGFLLKENKALGNFLLPISARKFPKTFRRLSNTFPAGKSRCHHRHRPHSSPPAVA